MNICGMEHLGLVVTDSRSMAEWYGANLGFGILASRPTPKGHVAFIQCPATGLVIELISASDLDGIEAAVTHPLQLHLAMKTRDIDGAVSDLVAAGAVFVTDCPTDDPGARVVILRDPWGNHVQLARRKTDFYR